MVLPKVYLLEIMAGVNDKKRMIDWKNLLSNSQMSVLSFDKMLLQWMK